jgi:hypothetical protein
VHDHEIIGLELFVLEHEQVDLPFDTLGPATGHEAVDFHDLHGNSETHNGAPAAIVTWLQ